MLYRLVTLLLFLLGSVPVTEAEEPVGYWLYVDGAWKGGFVSRAECDAAAAKTTGKLSECRALYPRPYVPRAPLRRAGAGNVDCLALSGDAFWACSRQQEADRAWEGAVQRCRSQARRYGMSFDAFVSGPGRAETVGPAHAIFAFEKCMTEAGQPLR